MPTTKVIDKIVNLNAGLIGFGETHHGSHYSFFQELSSRLDKFCGVFLEIPIDYQPSIKNYLANGEFDEKLEKI